MNIVHLGDCMAGMADKPDGYRDLAVADQTIAKPYVIGSLLMRSLILLEEMIDNHQADAVQMSEDHYKEVKKLVKDIRKSKLL